MLAQLSVVLVTRKLEENGAQSRQGGRRLVAGGDEREGLWLFCIFVKDRKKICLNKSIFKSY